MGWLLKIIFNKCFALVLVPFTVLPSISLAETTTTDVQPAAASSPEATELAGRLNTVHQCREQIWPGYKLGQFPTYVTDYNRTPPRVDAIDAATGAVTPPDDVALRYLRDQAETAYTLRVPNSTERSGVAISSRPQVDAGSAISSPLCPSQVQAYNHLQNGTVQTTQWEQSLDLLTHEAFHGVDQDPNHKCHSSAQPALWKRGSPSRTINADVDTKAKVAAMRAHVVESLRKALENPAQRDSYLRRAIAWQRKLASEYPRAVEELRSVDRAEGTASYVGLKATAIAAVGCPPPADGAALRQNFLRAGSQRFSETVMGLDRQSYGLGALAGYLMDELGISWKETTASNLGKSPMDILVEKIGGSRIEPNLTSSPRIQAASDRFREAQTCLNTEYMRPVAAAYANPQDYVAIALPIQGATQNEGDPVLQNNMSWLPSMSQTGQNHRIQQWPVHMLTDQRCGGANVPRAVVLVPRSSITLEGSQLSFNHQVDGRSVSGSVQVGAPNALSEFSLYCGS